MIVGVIRNNNRTLPIENNKKKIIIDYVNNEFDLGPVPITITVDANGEYLPGDLIYFDKYLGSDITPVKNLFDEIHSGRMNIDDVLKDIARLYQGEEESYYNMEEAVSDKKLIGDPIVGKDMLSTFAEQKILYDGMCESLDDLEILEKVMDASIDSTQVK